MGSRLGGAEQTEAEKPSTEETGELSGGPTQSGFLQLAGILTRHCLAGLSGAGWGCSAGNIQSQEQSQWPSPRDTRHGLKTVRSGGALCVHGTC